MSAWGVERHVAGLRVTPGLDSGAFHAPQAHQVIDTLILAHWNDGVTEEAGDEAFQKLRAAFIGRPYRDWLLAAESDRSAGAAAADAYKLDLAIQALREVAQSRLAGTDGTLQPMYRYDLVGAAVIYALKELGQVETISRFESRSGTRQTVWQGQRLRDHDKPSIFRTSLIPGTEADSPEPRGEI